MYTALKPLTSTIKPLHTTRSTCFQFDPTVISFCNSNSLGFKFGFAKTNEFIVDGGGIRAFTNFREGGGGGSTQELASSSPVSVEMEQILNEAQFDRVLADAQFQHKSVVILWMARWCRKCIYLKPKLEKLAADYFPRTQFYCIDVNNVPHKLVVRAGVTKMPTIQLWKESKKQDEVIGGHKAYMVVNEVREMIENEDPNV